MPGAWWTPSNSSSRKQSVTTKHVSLFKAYRLIQILMNLTQIIELSRATRISADPRPQPELLQKQPPTSSGLNTHSSSSRFRFSDASSQIAPFMALLNSARRSSSFSSHHLAMPKWLWPTTSIYRVECTDHTSPINEAPFVTFIYMLNGCVTLLE